MHVHDVWENQVVGVAASTRSDHINLTIICMAGLMSY